MKKLMYIGILVLGAAFAACGPSNTKIRPYAEVKEEVPGIQSIVTRADRGSIYIALKNVSEEELEIIWEDSTLGGDQVSHGTYVDINDYRLKQENTKMKKGEIFQTVLRRKNDLYYLDPVLYQPGGVKVKALKYPTDLVLKVKQGEKISNLETHIQQEESLHQKDVDARLQGAKDANFIPEFTDKKIVLREDKKIKKGVVTNGIEE